ncbi:hypothetical protein F5880DRAFT_1619173 [Lentinula raphanica]|nr:hypothetical protein F5880DRAFT_1619173 [Lentinula raphanica]
MASPTSATASSVNSLSFSTQATGTSVSSPTNDYAATFQSFVDFFKGPALVQHSFQTSATSSSAPDSSPSTNDYADMFQPFVEFFEGPVAIQRSSSTMTTSAVVPSNSIVPLSSTRSMDNHMAETSINPSKSNTNAPMVMCVITVITMVLFLWPALCANRRVAHRSPNDD